MALTGTDDDLWSALKVCLNDGDGARRTELTLALIFWALRGGRQCGATACTVQFSIACLRCKANSLRASSKIFNVSARGDLFGPNNSERSSRMNQYSGMICLMICPALSDR